MLYTVKIYFRPVDFWHWILTYIYSIFNLKNGLLSRVRYLKCMKRINRMINLPRFKTDYKRNSTTMTKTNKLTLFCKQSNHTAPTREKKRPDLRVRLLIRKTCTKRSSKIPKTRFKCSKS